MFNLVLLCSHEICLPEKHMVTVVTLIKDNVQDNHSPMLPPQKKKNRTRQDLFDNFSKDLSKVR